MNLYKIRENIKKRLKELPKDSEEYKHLRNLSYVIKITLNMRYAMSFACKRN